MKKWKMILALLLAMLCLTTAHAEVQSGRYMKVDDSHTDDGYITVQRLETEKKLMVVVKGFDNEAEYPLDEETAVLPLQFGVGTYDVQLYEVFESEEEEKRTTSLLDSISISASMEDNLACFLHPNIYVQYSPDSPWVQKAEELTRGITDPVKQCTAINDYIADKFIYDYIKFVTVPQDTLPDVQNCWENRMGIDQDLAALSCAMIRSRGIPAMLFKGSYTYGRPAYWVLAVLDNESIVFNPSEIMCAAAREDMTEYLFNAAIAY